MAMALLARGVLHLDDFRDAQVVVAVRPFVEITTIRVTDENTILNHLLLEDLVHAPEVAPLFVAITMRTLALAIALDHGLREETLKAIDDPRTKLALSETASVNRGVVMIEGDWCVFVSPWLLDLLVCHVCYIFSNA